MKTPRGSAGGDLLLFILFIIVLGVVWVYTGGPERSISREGPFINPPFPLGDGEAYSIPGVPIPSFSDSGSDTGYGGYFSGFFGGNDSLTENEEKSPYAEYVSLSISNARSESPDEEYLTVKTSSNMTGTLSISDWRLESTVSLNSYPLGRASYLPFSGQVNAESPVAVGPNTTVYVVSGRSPIGASFRSNRCTGYFGQFQDITPRLLSECPAPKAELAAYASRTGFVPSDDCISYVELLTSCTFTVNNIPQTLSNSCRSFIVNELTYNACVTGHKNDPDFYKSEWRLYLGRTQELWRQKTDRIRLLDENGKVIDVVSY